jgi:YD repeat-containing protein
MRSFRTRWLVIIVLISSSVLFASYFKAATLKNDPPEAIDDFFTFHGPGALTIFANDITHGQQPGNIQISAPANGWLNGYTYIPNQSFTGTESMSYSFCTNDGCTGASISIEVINIAPTAVANFYTLPDYGQSIVDDISANDTDPDDGPTGFNVSLDSTWQSPIHTSFARCGDRCWSFARPNGSNFVGYDSGQYRDVDWLGGFSNVTTISFYHPPLDDAEDAGSFCPGSKGEPVNVTNGNMWIEQRDYVLPGTGEVIDVDRFYNSIIQSSGLFGFGWSTKYDEYIVPYSGGDHMLGLHLPDGRAQYFGRSETTGSYTDVTTNSGDRIDKNVDGSYTVIFRDGRTHQFDYLGRLLWQKDRNGNQSTLTYDSNNFLTSIIDSFGRSLTLTPNANGTISQISDSIGVIADYEYYSGTALLKTVTYHDGSKCKFEYTTIGTKTLLTVVKDALDNVLESHAYDSQGRAVTSEKHGGMEKYNFDFCHG